jgi:diguanylate cyclase (GGDEF)-like protein
LEAKHFEVKLLSETDHLTGLFNRHTLENHSKMLFQLAQNYNQALSVVMMDLDHFKQVNDEYGHHVGDECLVFVASFLRGLNLRKRDIIARYGGEELIILLTDTALEPAMEIVESMCNGLKQFPVEGDHPDIYLTASFGVADIATSEAKTIEQLIQHADAALYLAKQNGRDRVEAFQKV